MNAFKYIMRQPIKSIAILVLLILATSFFSISLGTVISSNEIIKKADEEFKTVAVFRSVKYKRSVTERGSILYEMEEYPISDQQWEALCKNGSEEGIIKRVDQRKYVSAYSPQINTVLSTQVPDKYSSHFDESYCNSIIVFKINDMIKSYGGYESARAYVDVDEIVYLHPDHEKKNKLIVSFPNEYIEKYNIEVGGRYIAYGTYYDEELELKLEIASTLGTTVDKIDLSYLTYDEQTKWFHFPDVTKPKYEDQIKYKIGIKSSRLDINSVGSGNLYCYYVDYTKGYIPSGHNDEPYGNKTLEELIYNVTMEKLDGTVEEFFNTEVGNEYRLKKEELEMQDNCVVVIGTNELKGIYTFVSKDMYVSKGRAFTEDEYTNGNKVCIISENIAKSSGLKIGDKIDLSYYYAFHTPLIPQGAAQNMFEAGEFHVKRGFVGDKDEFEIVGIYKNTKEFIMHNYNFSVNTVFVPNNSLEVECYYDRRGYMTSILIENGKKEEFEELIKKYNIPEDYVWYHDGGYGQFENTVVSFRNSTVQLFVISCIASIAALVVYMATYVFGQKKTAGLMLSLGTGKFRTGGKILTISMVIVVIAVIIGTIISGVLLNNTVYSIIQSSTEVLSTDFSSSIDVGIEDIEEAKKILEINPIILITPMILQISIYAVCIAICINTYIRKSPLILMKSK